MGRVASATHAAWPLIGPPVVAAVGAGVAASQLGLPFTPTLLVAEVAAIMPGQTLASWRARARETSERLELRRRAQGRWRTVYGIENAPRAPEAIFILGVWAGGTIAWRPWDGSPPHLLIQGETGGGKSELIGLLAAEALHWRWGIEILDAKEGADFWAFERHGARVHRDREAQVEAIEAAAEDIADRNRTFNNTPIVIGASDGSLRESRPRTLREALAHRPDLRRAMPPRLLVADELASITSSRGREDKLAKRAQEALRECVQKGRSAGVQMIVGMQRSDADLLDGFVKANIGARILLGTADGIAESMALGRRMGVGADADAERLARPAGRGVAVNVDGAHQHRDFHAFLLDRSLLLPRLETSSPTLGGELVPGEHYPGAGDRQESTGGPGSSAAGAAGDGSGPVAGWPRWPESARLGLLAEPTGTPRSGPSPAGAPARPAGTPSALRRLLARVALRLHAQRLWVGPRLEETAPRDPSFRKRVVAAAKVRRCATCHDATVLLHAEHRRPRWAGGKDETRNGWLLCARCHDAKTGAERKIRDARRRLAEWDRPSLPVWVILIALAGLAGFVRAHVPIGPDLRFLAVALFVLVYLAGMMLPRAPRGTGWDRSNTWDLERESLLYQERPVGAMVRARLMLVLAVQDTRITLAGVGLAYLSGWYLIALALLLT